jgi:hypothetical protein
MRKGDVMKRWAFSVLIPAFGLLPLYAIDGVVMNATTRKPQAGVKVTLVHPGENGMQQLGSAETDAQGKFQIDKEVPPPPALLQADYKGVNYNLVLAPGAPSSGVSLSVYDTTTKPEASRMSQHIYVFEPGSDKLRVSETFLLTNETNTTFEDPSKGSLQVYIPGEPQDGLMATIEAPGGMPIRRPLARTAQPNVYKLDYPVKPGETRIDVAYNTPSPEKFSAKLLRTDGPTRLATPGSVTLSGENIHDLGQEPQTQARLYEVSGNSFDANLVGIGSLHRDAEDNSSQEDSGAPQIQEVPARIYSRLPWVLGLAFGMLALGGVYLFRRGEA